MYEPPKERKNHEHQLCPPCKGQDRIRAQRNSHAAWRNHQPVALAHGWKLLDLQPPSDPPPFGKEYAVTGYTETATDIRANWKLVPRESSPRTFSKLKVVIALTRIGKWAAIRDWLNETDYGDLFDAAQDFREDNADFIAALSTAQGRFGFTDEETAALLAECVAD